MEINENISRENAPRGRNVVLIGFMGCGKTTVGEMLAADLGFGFLDTDHEIEARAGMTIPEIFEKSGEEGFRKLEREVVETLISAEVRDKVIATGGGMATKDDNVELLRKLGYVIWLDVQEDQLWERVCKNRNRPLLRTEDPRGTLRDLLEKRRPMYEKAAHFAVESSELTMEEVTHGIAAQVRVHFAQS